MSFNLEISRNQQMCDICRFRHMGRKIIMRVFARLFHFLLFQYEIRLVFCDKHCNLRSSTSWRTRPGDTSAVSYFVNRPFLTSDPRQVDSRISVGKLIEYDWKVVSSRRRASRRLFSPMSIRGKLRLSKLDCSRSVLPLYVQ